MIRMAGENTVREKDHRQENELNFICNGLYEIYPYVRSDWIPLSKVGNKGKGTGVFLGNVKIGFVTICLI